MRGGVPPTMLSEPGEPILQVGERTRRMLKHCIGTVRRNLAESVLVERAGNGLASKPGDSAQIGALGVACEGLSVCKCKGGASMRELVERK